MLQKASVAAAAGCDKDLRAFAFKERGRYATPRSLWPRRQKFKPWPTVANRR